ncbi:aldehyde dehydrogenase family protein [Sporichthya brevicatena]|uniref:Aldehyde dehydrogenase family protein n=1 Tax=Sporichthya brevicatena TaxID=171442 RepID=A0ABN1H6R2_9ACTN
MTTTAPAPIEVRCPADGRIVGTVANQTRDEVGAVAAKLREAQPAWEALGPEARGKHLRDWRDWLLDNERRLGELVQSETGKSWADASMETALGVDIISYLTKNGPEFLAPRKVSPHSPAGATKKMRVVYRPYPVVGLITPWNGPIGNPLLDVVGALLAGATVLTKPSEYTPLSWIEVVRGWREDIGAPPVLEVVTGAGETGAAVVDAVDMVMFTGSARTGKRIAARCGERLIPCSLELGGKDAMIVLADADLDRATSAAAWGGFLNAGQACISVERVYVEAPIYDEFVRKVTEKVAGIRVGMDAPGEFATEIGAIATEDQLQIIETHVEDAKAKGARITTGGKRRSSGQFFEPTVIADVNHSMDCMRHETFGPTLPIMKVANEDEAVRLANDSPYGLSASVFSSNPDRAQRVADQLQAGAVNMNNVLSNLFQLTLPMGGWKESGIGTRLGGANAVLKFCRPQAQISERVALKSEVYWFPISKRKATMQAKAMRMMAAGDWRRRLGLRGR